MTNPLETIIQQTLAAHADLMRTVGEPARAAAFQWPWDIASAGATFLGRHLPAVSALVEGGNKIAGSPSGSSIVGSVSNGPTDPTNTDKILNNGIFADSLNAVKSDQLLHTVFIGWSAGAQVGFLGGGGGSGVAYDIINQSDRATVGFSSFNLGIGAGIRAGLLLGAMTVPPHQLNYSTCVWQAGASLAVSVLVTVMMNSSDLSLVGFGLTLGSGIGLSTSSGYGSITAS